MTFNPSDTVPETVTLAKAISKFFETKAVFVDQVIRGSDLRLYKFKGDPICSSTRRMWHGMKFLDKLNRNKMIDFLATEIIVLGLLAVIDYDMMRRLRKAEAVP